MRMTDRWKHTHEHWGVLSYYQRFESAGALVLTFIVGAIIVIALYRLTLSVVVGLIFVKADPLQPEVFQNIFGEVLTLLIALEFSLDRDGVA